MGAARGMAASEGRSSWVLSVGNVGAGGTDRQLTLDSIRHATARRPCPSSVVYEGSSVLFGCKQPSGCLRRRGRLRTGERQAEPPPTELPQNAKALRGELQCCVELNPPSVER
jgi:hypothetical protein